MTEAEKKAIDGLLSDITDGDGGDAHAKLGELLLDRPDLQTYYSRSITVLTLLDLEFLQAASRSGSASDMCAIAYPSSLSQQAIGPETDSGALARSSLKAIERPATEETDDQSVVRTRRSIRRVLATCLAIAGCAALVFSPMMFGYSDQAARLGEARIWSSSVASEGQENGLEVRDQASLRLLDKLTRQPLVTNIVLPRASASSRQELTLCSGSAWIHRTQRHIERGYLVALPVGCLMKVDIDTEAKGRNSLAVVEMDASGLATGETLLFDNSSTDDAQPGGYDAGLIGSFSKRNTSDVTEYYLLTGSYMLSDSEGGENWYQSDYKIQFDAENILVIGWDDSGYAGKKEDYDKHFPDRDYNDMRAVLRFSFPDAPRRESGTLSRFLPNPIPEGPSARGQTGWGYTVDLRPGEEALISASTDASLQNALRVLEADSGRILWKHDGFASGQPVDRPNDLGVYLIRNTGETVQRYEIQGRYKLMGATEKDPWFNSEHRVLDADDQTLIVGFEDSPGSPHRIDWADLRVFVRIFSP